MILYFPRRRGPGNLRRFPSSPWFLGPHLELDASRHEYWHRRVEKERTYVYALVAVNDEGREGEAAFVTIR